MTPRTKKNTNGRHPHTRSVSANSALLLINIGQLLTLRSPDGKSGPRRGSELGQLSIIEDAAVLCAGGRIVAVGTTREALRDRWIKVRKSAVQEFDCKGRVVVPGFVDSHTHPVFAQPRLVDFEKRTAGATYEEIAAAGGGIRASINGVREAPKTVLAEQCLRAFDEMLAQGTTTVEAKSGYGLSVEAELKSLEVIRNAARKWPGTVVPTLLGAHVVPPEYKHDRSEYVRLVCEEMIPQAANNRLARFVDAFVERGAFDVDESERIFQVATDAGLGVRAHVCQLTPAKLDWLWRYQPASVDHMDYVDQQDMEELRRRDTIATLLPGADYFLGLPHYPEARKLIESGVAVALATDYNPGTSPTPSMPFVMSLACTHMKMNPAEAIAASTINAAHALRLADRKGSVEPGKDADFAVFDVVDYREIPYWFAADKCMGTVAGGEMHGGQIPR
ncbi:MAG TPA: imidazolonepropionase [Terriglobales bacterium]|nr:imidazolonepropionase [Terriglobales bacterium]